MMLYSYVIIRTILAFILLTAAVLKTAAIESFREALTMLLPPVLARHVPLISVTVILAEGACSILVLVGAFRSTVDLVVVGLFACFVLTALVGAWLRPGLRCECFGPMMMHRFGPKLVVRNFVLLGAALGMMLTGLNVDANLSVLDVAVTSLLTVAIAIALWTFASVQILARRW